MFEGSFKGVSEKLHICFMKVTRKIEGCFEVGLRVFPENFKGVSGKFQR